MTTAALQILESFDRLADDEKQRVAREILRRSDRPERRSPPILGIGEFRSDRSDVAARAEDLMRDNARTRR